jgi:electron transfer flavoprotein beta subunit
MNIIVCIKQVLDAKDVHLDPVTNNLVREGVPSIMNPYDHYAVEEAVRLRELLGGKVTVLTMGPPQAEEVLRQAVSCGADHGVLVSDRAFAGADTWATSYTLAMAVQVIGAFDLILLGKQAIDGDTAQVGPSLAMRLGIPYVTCVQKVREATDSGLILERMMDDGYDLLAVDYPVLLTVVKGINQPRVPSLKGKMRAKTMEMRKLSAADIGADPLCIGLPGSPTQVEKVFSPPVRSQGTVFTGSLDEQIDQLVDSLKPYL